MEHGGSLPLSQNPATCPYPDPDKPSQRRYSNCADTFLILSPSKPRSFKCSVSLMFAQQSPTCYMTQLAYKYQAMDKYKRKVLFNVGWKTTYECVCVCVCVCARARARVIV